MNENNNQSMTVRQVVEQIIGDLGKIEVRMIDLDRYGIPIARAIAGLQEICKAWDMQEEQEKASQDGQEESEIKLELVSAEEVPEEAKNE